MFILVGCFQSVGFYASPPPDAPHNEDNLIWSGSVLLCGYIRIRRWPQSCTHDPPKYKEWLSNGVCWPWRIVTGHRPFLTHVLGSNMVGKSVDVVGTILDMGGK